tara:strand:+ start:1094 stop:1279 length:186 start_codon:yes stop_codon:yes gene_type:complete
MKFSVNDYESGTLNIYELNGEQFEKSDFDVENYISTVLGYSLSNIEWFVFKQIEEYKIDYD